jgi:hypothetical protein
MVREEIIAEIAEGQGARYSAVLCSSAFSATWLYSVFPASSKPSPS